ncbi:MAG: hypothetical protein BMS9Abin29_2400 [Gemmatimonadota bacterium]|nr:MAG: hypothetical protein BMS9Abin29_2400 [Gemmatimonadota bacterium]
MTKEDSAIQGRPIRFATLGPTEWLLVHGGILIAWFVILSSSVAAAMALHSVTPLTERSPDVLTTYRDAGGWMAVALLTILAGPIVEEFVFRGWLQRALEHRLSPITAVTIAAVTIAAAAFALLHGLS